MTLCLFLLSELTLTRRRLKEELDRSHGLKFSEKDHVDKLRASVDARMRSDLEGEIRPSIAPITQSPPRKKLPLRNNYLSPEAGGRKKRPRVSGADPVSSSPVRHDSNKGSVEVPKTVLDALPFIPPATTTKAKFDLLPILTYSGETAFEVGLNPPPQSNQPPEHMLPVFRLPTVTSTDFVNRIPRDDNDQEKTLRKKEEEEFEAMKDYLGLTTKEVLEMEHMLGEF